MLSTIGLESGILCRAGAEIHYWMAGPADAPLVVFSHGATIDHSVWNPQLDFSQHYRILTYDIRGHGKSTTTTAFRFDDAVDDLDALLDAVGASTAVLVGLSMGGNISQEIAHRDPDRISALVLADCACNTWPATRTERWTVNILFPLLGLFPRKRLIRRIAQLSSVVPAVRLDLREAAGPMPSRQVRAILTSLFSAMRPDPGYHAPMPQLLLRGEHDSLGNFAKVMPLWQQHDPQARYEIIHNAGHVSNMDNPDHFNRLLGEFLDKVTR